VCKRRRGARRQSGQGERIDRWWDGAEK